MSAIRQAKRAEARTAQVWKWTSPALPFWLRCKLLFVGRLTLVMEAPRQPTVLGLKVGVTDE